MQSGPQQRGQVRFLDVIEQLAALIVQRGARCGSQRRIDAVGARQPEHGVRALLRAGAGHGQHAAEKLAVVAHLYSSVALEALHANAELLHHLEMRGCVSGAARASRGFVGQTFGHSRNGIEGLGGERSDRRGFQVGGAVTDAEGLGSRGVTQEAQNGEQLGRGGLGERHRPHRLAAQVAAPLAMIVVDLEIPGALAPDFDDVPLRECRELRGGGARRRAQGGVVQHDDRDRCSEGEDHREPCAAVLGSAAVSSGLVKP